MITQPPKTSPDAPSATDSLTVEQLAVATHASGHARVIAVAGAGKTTTLTHFIRTQLEAGTSPRRMLVLMYNKSAQQDFKHKLKACIPNRVLPEIRTFHSLGWRIYQRLIQEGVLPAYAERLLSDAEMDGQLWRLLQQLTEGEIRQDILSQRKKWVEPALMFIDRVKSGLESPADVFDAMELPSECRIFIELFDAFEAWRKQQRRISYADMIYDPVCCFRDQPDVAKRFGGHMQWVLVDEYQDINAIQQSLIDVIYGGRGALMVIGDPDQTIYEFRGSRPEYIVSGFQQRFGADQPVHQYQLPHTFRYGHALSLVANHLIQHNQQRDPVLCLSHLGTPETQVESHEASTASEAQRVVALIQSASQHTALEEIAVIHRLWALCAPIELELLRQGIAYQLHHNRSVLERQELQIFWLLLEIAAGEFAQRTPSRLREGWLLLLTTPFPKIKRDVLEQLADRLSSTKERLGVALQEAIPGNLSRWQKQQLNARAELLDSAEYQSHLPVQRLLTAYVDQTELEQGIEESAFSRQQVEDRLQTIRAFIRFMANTDLPAEDALAYLQALQQQRLEQAGTSASGVHLTSIHKSKGLEWHTVIIPGLNRHYFPYQPEGEFASPPSLESERRLLYVAMTRAREALHLIVPSKKGRASGDDEPTARELPSPFAQELQLVNSQRLAKALTQRSAQVVHQGQPADWLNDYLLACDYSPELTLDLVSAPAEAEAIARKTRSAPQKTVRAARKERRKSSSVSRTEQAAIPTAKGKRVQHKKLGDGTLLEDQSRYWVIHFDRDQSTRTLDKQIAKDFLVWLK